MCLPKKTFQKPFVFMWIFDYTSAVILLGCLCLGLLSGALSPVAVIRKESLFGDVISHAVFPGVALGYVMSYKFSNPYLIYLTAMLAALGIANLYYVLRKSVILTKDSLLAALLCVFFSLGMVLLSVFQKTQPLVYSGLQSFLFGSAASLLVEDVVLLGAAFGLWLAFFCFKFREIELLLFDRSFARVQVHKFHYVERVLLIFMITCIVMGLRSVGVVLMGALLVMPAMIVEPFVSRFKHYVTASCIVGLLGCFFGALFSLSFPKLPTGALIVLILALLQVVSWGASWAFGQRRLKERV